MQEAVSELNEGIWTSAEDSKCIFEASGKAVLDKISECTVQAFKQR